MGSCVRALTVPELLLEVRMGATLEQKYRCECYHFCLNCNRIKITVPNLSKAVAEFIAVDIPK